MTHFSFRTLPILACTALCSTLFFAPISSRAQDIGIDVSALRDPDEAANKILIPQGMNAQDLRNYVHHEATFSTQKAKVRRSTEEQPLTLGEMLGSLLTISKDKVRSMTVMRRATTGGKDQASESATETKFYDNTDEIMGFDVFASVLSCIPGDNAKWPVELYNETVLAIKLDTGTILVTLVGLDGTDHDKYARATIIIPDVDSKDDSRTFKTQNGAVAVSLLLAHQLDGDNPYPAKFEEIEKSVMKKNANDEEFDEFEDEYLFGRLEFRGGYYVLQGKQLLDDKRYYDAYVLLKRYFDAQLPRFHKLPPNQLETFREVCDWLHDCLNAMGRKAEASYYAKQGTLGATLGTMGSTISAKIDVTPTFSVTDNITLGDVLHTTMHLKETNVRPIMFIYDNATGRLRKTVQSIEEIMALPLDKSEACDKTFVLSTHHSQHLLTYVYDISTNSFHAPLVITTHRARTEQGENIVRVDVVQSNFRLDDDKLFLTDYNMPLATSLVLGLKDDKTFTASTENYNSALHYAHQLTEQYRPLEAYKVANWVFANLYKERSKQANFSAENQMLLNEANYRVGYDLQELERFEEASYYLENASSGSYTYMTEYINCLVNSGNPIALSVIEEALANTVKPKKKEEQEDWKRVMAFLKRRKVYLLIEMERIDEARTLLKQLLKDPLCKDFAEGELQYIDSLGQ